MPDREKYIEILSKVAKAVKELNEDAPIKISLECIEDILELLKEQEAVEPIRICTNHEQHWKCGKCHAVISLQDKFCHECGTPIAESGEVNGKGEGYQRDTRM